MGISTKFINLNYAACFITALCFLIPGFVAAQKKSNDVPVKVNGKKFYRHIVGKGETVYGIAQKFDEQPKDIIFENPKAIDGIHPGDTLMIPVIVKTVADTSTVKGNYVYHEVVGKETVYSLSKRYNTTVSAIDSLNPEITVKGLQIGHKIRIPVAQSAPAEKHVPVKDTSLSAQKGQTNPNKNETQAFKALVGGQAPATDTSKSVTAYKDTGKKLNRYHIALIMPFTSGSTDTIKLSRLLEGTAQIPRITQISIDFYHGLIQAFDSLGKKGFKVDLHVFNISTGSDSSSSSLDSIMKNPLILKMNLIIGPPYPSHYRRLARFAGIHRIPIISPLSSESNVLKNNPWTSKIVPSTVTETEMEADYIASHYSRDNIIIVHSRDKDANSQYYDAFRKRFHISDSALGRKDTLCHAESYGGVAGLAGKISNTLTNVIVMPYQGSPFVAKFVNELANSKYAYSDSLILFGMHGWAMNDALAPDNLDTLKFHFPSNEFMDYSDAATKKFIAQYRSSYLSEPSYYSCEGYDAGMFYGNILLMYGTDIGAHLGDAKYRGLQTSFNMLRINPTTGYENNAVYILEYSNYKVRLDAK